jgi:hypothetical protein
LASSPPPDDHLLQEEVHAEDEGGVTVQGNDFATTVNVELGIDPGEVGDNGFTVHIDNYDTGEPLEAVRVALRFTIPDRPDFGPAPSRTRIHRVRYLGRVRHRNRATGALVRDGDHHVLPGRSRDPARR